MCSCNFVRLCAVYGLQLRLLVECVGSGFEFFVFENPFFFLKEEKNTDLRDERSCLGNALSPLEALHLITIYSAMRFLHLKLVCCGWTFTRLAAPRTLCTNRFLLFRRKMCTRVRHHLPRRRVVNLAA